MLFARVSRGRRQQECGCREEAWLCSRVAAALGRHTHTRRLKSLGLELKHLTVYLLTPSAMNTCGAAPREEQRIMQGCNDLFERGTVT